MTQLSSRWLLTHQLNINSHVYCVETIIIIHNSAQDDHSTQHNLCQYILVSLLYTYTIYSAQSVSIYISLFAINSYDYDFTYFTLFHYWNQARSGPIYRDTRLHKLISIYSAQLSSNNVLSLYKSKESIVFIINYIQTCTSVPVRELVCQKEETGPRNTRVVKLVC